MAKANPELLACNEGRAGGHFFKTARSFEKDDAGKDARGKSRIPQRFRGPPVLSRDPPTVSYHALHRSVPLLFRAVAHAALDRLNRHGVC